jgi:hypothetical protein
MTIKRIIATSVAITMMTTLQIPAAHSAGRSTKQTVNTILNGKGAPKSSIGIDGDFYIDTRSLLIYGPKAKGKWLSPRNLQGPTGPSGSDGRNGNDGKTISTASSTTGTQGPQGVAGPQGPQGIPGEKGDAGLAGSPGPAGVPGSPGPAGPAGSPGAQGPTGPTGATGAPGISASSSITYGSLAFGDFSSSTPASQSVQITGFKAGKKYLLRTRIYLFQPLDITEYFLPLSLSVTSSTGAPVVHIGYLLNHGYSFRENITRYENSIDAEIVLDGSAISIDFGLRLWVTVGRSTAGAEKATGFGDFTMMEIENTQNYA